MKSAHLQPDLLFCRQCRRHFRGKRKACPSDGTTLELVTAFLGQAGDVLDDRYVLQEQIGVGGMGTVYKALDQLGNRQVALKLLRAEYASNATSAQRFFAEARLVRLVNHPGVVGLHRFARTKDGTLLIDMELVEGESVRDRILRQGKGFDFQTAMLILESLLASLGACHDAGVIHCDVKPENMMLPKGAAPGQIKLVDFGIAQAPGPIVQTDDVGVVGTPAYMSPEQVRGVSVDARTDLYLVGCVAYEVLSGEPPFLGQTPIDLCHAQMLTPPPPLTSRVPADEIPEGFEAWLMPLLHKDPTMRPNSTRSVRDALRQIRLTHRRAVAEQKLASSRVSLRPPSANLLRRPEAEAAVRRAAWEVEGVRALIEVRQVPQAGKALYGPEAIEQIARHVLASSVMELREMGAEVSGPAGPHLEVRLPCGGDARGTIAHLLDTVAAMHTVLARIPEPRLEIRAAVVAAQAGGPGALQQVPGLDPLQLLELSPVTQIRVDEHVARWAGRRALVKLTSLPSPDRVQMTDVYATSLHPV